MPIINREDLEEAVTGTDAYIKPKEKERLEEKERVARRSEREAV